VIWGGPVPITNLIDEFRVSTCVDQELNTSPAAVVVSIGLRSGGGLVGTILERLQERPERRHLVGLPRPGKKQAYLQQRLGAYAPYASIVA
jgi:hypothetical protein